MHSRQFVTQHYLITALKDLGCRQESFHTVGATFWRTESGIPFSVADPSFFTQGHRGLYEAAYAERLFEHICGLQTGDPAPEDAGIEVTLYLQLRIKSREG